MNIVEKESITVVGIPVRASWKQLWIEMPKVWERLFDRRAEILHATDFVDVSLRKDGDEYYQLVGRPVSRVDGIPFDMIAVEVPAQRLIHYRHVGPTRDIAASFGRIYHWADDQGLDAGDFKLDFGYTVEGNEQAHDLFVGLLPATPWREVAGE